MAEVLRIYIDLDLKDYEQFYDHGRGRTLTALASGTRLEKSADHLCATWKTSSNSMRLPHLSVASIESVGLGGVVGTRARRIFLRTLSRALQFNILMPKGFWQLIENQIQRIGAAYGVAEKETKKTFNKELVWHEFMHFNGPDGGPVVEFPMAVWGSQQIGFGATYHAYENFLREVMVELTGKADYRIYYDGKIQKDITTLLDKSISDQCIDDDQIKIAKEIRNVLAHQGGQVEIDPPTTDDFKGFRVINKVVQITATKNRELFLLLQDRAYVFAEAALKKL